MTSHPKRRNAALEDDGAVRASTTRGIAAEWKALRGGFALSSLLRFAAQLSLAAWAVALLTFCAYVLRLGLSTAGFLYLVIVVSTALLFGFWQATLISLLASACMDYFVLPPLLSFNIGDSQNLIALATFEFSALVVGRLSSREKRHALEAKRQRNSMETLYQVSRDTLMLDVQAPPGPQIVKMIRERFDLECVAFFDEALGRADSSGSPAEHAGELARVTYLEGRSQDDSVNQAAHRVLRSEHELTGGLYLRGSLDPLTADALASLTSIALERWRSFEKESRAEAARQSEQMRTAVLDALAHAFKTPLTAIRAASAGLIEIGNLSEAQLDLASLVEEQSAELNDLATRLLQTARLDAVNLSVAPEDVMVSGLITEVLTEQRRKLDQHPVEVSIQDGSLATQGDRGLLATIVGQFVDNAAKYSPPALRFASPPRATIRRS